MNSIIRPVAIALLLLTSACSTVFEGRTQTIAVDTFPSGAQCLIKDNDIVLGKVNTPGRADIPKSKNDILVECTKDGYITNKSRNKSDVAISSLGNMAFGQWSFVGNIVDSASGASHKYDSKVFMALNALPPAAQTPAEGDPFAMAANQPATQLAGQLAQLMGGQNVIISQKSPEEVIRLLASGAPITGDGAASQQVAGLAHENIPIQHSAE